MTSAMTLKRRMCSGKWTGRSNNPVHFAVLIFFNTRNAEADANRNSQINKRQEIILPFSLNRVFLVFYRDLFVSDPFIGF